MNSHVMPAPVMVDGSILNSIVEVKETVATLGSPKQGLRSFGVADLWNIRRNARWASSLVRRY